MLTSGITPLALMDCITWRLFCSGIHLFNFTRLSITITSGTGFSHTSARPFTGLINPYASGTGPYFVSYLRIYRYSAALSFCKNIEASDGGGAFALMEIELRVEKEYGKSARGQF